MNLTIQHIRLAHANDIDGALIYDGDGLIAVLSRLSLEHGVRAGRWFLECGFGAAFDGHADFIDIAAACAWIEGRLSDQQARHPAMHSRL